MGLKMAGILSGLGQGMQAAATQYGQYLTQSALQGERAKADDLRLSRMEATQAKMFEATQSREDTRQGKQFAQQETMYGKETERMAGHEQRAIDAAAKSAQVQIDKMVELHTIDSEQAKQFHSETMALSKAQLRATINGVQSTTPLKDGSILAIMKDGKSSLLKDEKGNVLYGPHDVTESAKIMAKINAGLAEAYEAELTRNGLTMTKDEKDLMYSRITSLRENSAKLLGMSESAKTSTASSTLTPVGQRNRATYESDKAKFGGYNQTRPNTPLIP